MSEFFEKGSRAGGYQCGGVVTQKFFQLRKEGKARKSGGERVRVSGEGVMVGVDDEGRRG